MVSDSALARAGLAAVLGQVPGAVVGALVPAAGAVAAAAEVAPEAALIDLEGLDEEAIDELVESLSPLPVVGMGSSAGGVSAALDAGLAAAMGVESTPAEIAAALAAAVTGLVVLRRSDLDLLRPQDGHAAMEMPVEKLTKREGEILQLMAQGLTNRRIASRLGISDHTVKFHCTAILGKLGAATRAEAVGRGARLGWILV